MRPAGHSTNFKLVSVKNIRITNQNSKHRLKHGHDFKDLLDARDMVLEHDFNFTIALRPEDISKEFIPFQESQLYGDILKNVR
jgi:hypothetical protein